MDCRTALLTVLDYVDYEEGNCAITSMVGATLPKEIIQLARESIQQKDYIFNRDNPLDGIFELKEEIRNLHHLLDLRDRDYFEFCETGRIPDEEDTADAE